jgi:hypothetical protein
MFNGKKYGECVDVCEFTANLWIHIHTIEKYNIVVKPSKSKAIAEAKIKTDTRLQKLKGVKSLNLHIKSKCAVRSRLINSFSTMIGEEDMSVGASNALFNGLKRINCPPLTRSSVRKLTSRLRQN